MAASSDRPGEFELIARYFRPLATAPEAFSLADDAATLPSRPGEDWVVTKDMIVEGIHYLPDDPPASIARKALRVNLSDLAAKGAIPVAYCLGLALTEAVDADWLAGFAAGLAGDQSEFGVTLLGGDTVRSAGGVTISVTAFGALPHGTMVHRSGARPGDVVLVSGTIGDAALGLRVRYQPELAASVAVGHLLDRYLHPRPRVALAALVRRYARAAMDVSDGLVGDLGHICRASGVSAEIDAADVPLSGAARALATLRPDLLATVLGGGDDYEILMTAAPERAEALIADAAAAGVPVTAIGRVLAGEGPPRVRGADGAVLDLAGKTSWVHR